MCRLVSWGAEPGDAELGAAEGCTPPQGGGPTPVHTGPAQGQHF
jgi:hypothetical protein